MLKKKNTLLTGVVFPLMSLAIAVEPAAAGFAGASRAQAPISQVAPGQIILAQAEPAQENPEEELKKKRQQAEEAQPQAEPKREERAPEPQREPEPKREAAPAEPRPEPKREAPPEPQQREARPEPAPAEQPQERPRTPERAKEPQGEGEQRPARQREAAPEAAPAEQQPQERPRKPARAEQPAADGEQRPERPRREPAKEPAAEQQPAARPENSEQPAKPAPEKKPVEEKAPEQKAAPAEKPVPEKKPAAPEPAAKEAPVPTEAPTPARPPAPEAQPNPAPGQQPSEQPPVKGEPAAPLPGTPTPPPSGATTGQAPAGEAVPNQVAIPQTEAPPMTKEELDKAKAIAKDPSKTADTVILPVDKGAAVLDSDKEVERSGNRQTREERRREREQAGDVKVPTSDAEAQRAGAAEGKAPPPPVKMEAITSQQGERVDRRPQYERPEGVREWQPREGRPRDRDRNAPIILQFGDRVVVRGDDNQRFIRDGGEPYYERLPGGRVRETVERRDGTQVVTIRNRYGDVIQRSRIDDRGREYVLFYAPELMEDPDRDYVYRDPGLDLPPMRLRIPVTDYIIDTSSDPDRDYYRFLEQPPVEPVERVYSLDEVRYSARIRDKVRRIDLDTITFATGSAEIPMAQARSLRKVADAINKALDKNPGETFLIEGHTDAVGSDESNLVLSDERAASVANVLTDVYGIPPENLATQGYGERYLKVQTLGPEQQNRRVTIRRVTPLVKPVAQN
ncbi:MULTISPECIES: OmpA family protein [Agrobacterium]|uniref:OmpA family protein n=1 Tax=Agrobacterium salinitolerans TaxID=1183413 RepID=A0A4Z1RE43_9HYPH|nr:MULTISPECIES: OmpA family protein [Agrobacterium]MCZ7851073.1 OmpA family protein [Agrobacterium salinitolerans]MCZ7939984.1 OmpA family protein [Agrobacterium salinitolerans]MCZ7976865.1 OmpA family protein [Agrobacterium salinitolerans]MDA5639948.1 OmpA family protein [Agrobacterium sp. ST15.13.013]MDA6999908.1 OmpA family protein [Agrobacterium salinitolerans]